MMIGEQTMRSDFADEQKSYFDRLYARHDDPGRYEACSYEIDKGAETLSFLHASYERACEIGCSNGVLTEQLAPRCRELIAIDAAEAATTQARARLVQWPQVEIRLMHLPHQELDGNFNLMVLSEMLSFLSAPELSAMAALAVRHVVPGGDLIIVSQDGETETELTGRQATDLLLEGCVGTFDLLRDKRRQGYHVRLLQRRHAAD